MCIEKVVGMYVFMFVLCTVCYYKLSYFNYYSRMYNCSQYSEFVKATFLFLVMMAAT